MSGMSLDEFMSHSNKGPRGQFLRGWKKRKPPQVDTLLHTQARIHSLWQHGLPSIEAITDRDTGAITKVVWNKQRVCWEEEELLKVQYRRDRGDGSRMRPPVKCGVCRTAEYLRQLVKSEELGIEDAVFRFQANEDDDEKDIVTIHAGGFAGMFNDKLGEDDKRALRKADISLKNAWRENGLAKMNYVFTVVDNDAVEDGLQIAIETSLLGDKVREVIRKAEKSLGEKGSPWVQPYVIRWEYDGDAAEFHKRYDATRMENVKIGDDARRLITEEDPPDLATTLEPFDQVSLREDLKRACLIDLPWDDLFPNVAAAAEQAERPVTEVRTKKNGAPAAKLPPKAPPAAKPKSEPEPDMVACDKCDAPMRATDQQCKKCGTVYEVEEADASPPPPPPKLPKRSELKKAAAPVEPARGAGRPAPVPEPTPESEADEDGGIPF